MQKKMHYPHVESAIYIWPAELHSQAQAKMLLNHHSDALPLLAESCAIDPLNIHYWLSYAECLKHCDMPELALQAYITVSKLKNSSIINTIIGYLNEELGRFNEALNSYTTSIYIDPYKYEAYNCKGNLLRRLRRHSEAIIVFYQGIQLCGANEHLYNNLGNCFSDLEMIRDAQQCYFEAVRLMPSMASAHCNLSAALKAEGRIPEAIEFCEKALRIDPSFSDAYACMGNILKDTPNLQQSIAFYSQALQLNPNSPPTLLNLGNILKDTGDIPQAISCYSKALTISKWFPEAFCNMVYSKIFICDWEDIQSNFEQIAVYTKHQMEHSLIPSVQPFHALVYPLAPEDKLIISKAYAHFASMLVQKCMPFPKQMSEGKIRVGYVSSDFGDHPCSHLLQSVYGMHDRSLFEVYGFALSPDDGSDYRRKIIAGCDFFMDLSGISDARLLAEVIYKHKVDVLINLNGYTKGSRNEMFALRPGRVQISFMGFPGTMGAEYIEYIVSDKTTSPEAYCHFYSEKIIWMPHSYFVNDYLQTDRYVLNLAARPSRGDLLPNDKFVFANFNQLYKIDPDTFQIWMNILKKVPNSVLWLLKFPASGEVNLKKSAAKENVNPSRIIFTDLAPKKEHINRCFLADLCLDTPLCNGHTTSCDVLWSGLPIITLPLKNMASRVAAGLCEALECPEFVMKSPEEYEETAIRLATGLINESIERDLPSHIRDRQGSTELKLRRLKIEEKRTTSALFDTARWVKNLEKGLKTAVELESCGLDPKHIEILDS